MKLSVFIVPPQNVKTFNFLYNLRAAEEPQTHNNSTGTLTALMPRRRLPLDKDYHFLETFTFPVTSPFKN